MAEADARPPRPGPAAPGGSPRLPGLAASGARPVFVVGCARSGTTLLRVMLDSHPRLSAGEETHFLVELETLLGRYWPRLESYGLPRQEWQARIADFFDGVLSDYARRRGRARWVDKTPKYVMHLDFIDALFPSAQIVHVIRDGRDVVASHLDRWGWTRAARCAATTWRKSVEAGRAFGARAGVGAARYHEVRYEELVREPEATLRRLLAFLDEPWDPAVLAYDRAPHDAGDRHASFTESRRAQGGGGLVYESRVGAGRRQLDPVLRALLQASSGRLLAELGYT